jgi:GT2 family glycosyltransferase
MKMPKKSTDQVSVIVPNWNGMDSLGDCLDSLLAQTIKPRVIVVENGSKDGSLDFIQKQYPHVELVINKKNLGFAGGVNGGIRRAIELGDSFVALFNNDAVADSRWLEHLVQELKDNEDTGIATCKLMDQAKTHLDSTGDQYTTWGLPFPRGRGEPISNNYDNQNLVFGASGGASLYRVSMLQQIGLFDEDFFAYYEDVDISFRAQLAGWKIRYVPVAIAYHQIGATSRKIKGFTTYQTVKNLPWLLWKNAPTSVLIRILPRFIFAYMSFMISASVRDQGIPALQGYFMMLFGLPKKTVQRYMIWRKRTVRSSYIWSIMTHELPPNARKMRILFHPIKTLGKKS